MTQRTLMGASSSADKAGSGLDLIAYACLCAFVFAVPWEESVPLLGGFVIGRWLGLAAFVLTVLRVIASREGRKLSPLHYWMLGFVGWAALSLFWTVDWDSTAIRVGTYLQLLTAVWLIWELAVTEGRVVGLLQSFVFGTYVSAASTIVNLMLGRTAAALRVARGEAAMNATRYTIAGFNENDLALILALSIPMTFYLLTRRKGPLLALLYWVQLVICVTAILLTGSRGALLAAGASLLMFPLTVFRLPRWQRAVSVLACAGALACGAYLVPDLTWNRLLSVAQEASEGTLTHRTVIWAAGLEAFRDHAFLGVGAGSYAAAVLKALDVPYVAHNTFLSVLVELGVIGGSVLIGLLAVMFNCVSRMESLERRLWIVLLLTWTVGVSVLTWDYQKSTWLLFGMAAAHIYARRPERSYVPYRFGGIEPIHSTFGQVQRPGIPRPGEAIGAQIERGMIGRS